MFLIWKILQLFRYKVNFHFQAFSVVDVILGYQTVRCSGVRWFGGRCAGVPLPFRVISLHTKWPLIVCLVPFSAHSYTFVAKHISVSVLFSLIGIIFKRLLDYRMLSIFVLNTPDNRAHTRNAHDIGRATSPPHLDCPTLAVFR